MIYLVDDISIGYHTFAINFIFGNFNKGIGYITGLS